MIHTTPKMNGFANKDLKEFLFQWTTQEMQTTRSQTYINKVSGWKFDAMGKALDGILT